MCTLGLMQDRISCKKHFFCNCICFNKHNWALCPSTINFLFCFIFIWSVIAAELSLALLHWNQTGFLSFVLLLYFLTCSLSIHFHEALKRICISFFFKCAPFLCSLLCVTASLYPLSSVKAGSNLTDINGFG